MANFGGKQGMKSYARCFESAQRLGTIGPQHHLYGPLASQSKFGWVGKTVEPKTEKVKANKETKTANKEVKANKETNTVNKEVKTNKETKTANKEVKTNKEVKVVKEETKVLDQEALLEKLKAEKMKKLMANVATKRQPLKNAVG